MKADKIWQLRQGNGPLVATAIHDGHAVRPEVAELLALTESERLREEDPFTGKWTNITDTRIIGLRSRFEVDLNRPREKAVYLKPEDAWGLKVWSTEPSSEIVARSLAEYDAFYSETKSILTELERRYGHFVVLDLHSYNHRRDGQAGPVADPGTNPEVNIGTGTMDRERWAPIVERLIADLQNFDFLGRRLHVGENVKFQGGNFPRWIHENFPNSGCAIAIEFKKFFMNEWTGAPDAKQVETIELALQSIVPGILEELRKFSK